MFKKIFRTLQFPYQHVLDIQCAAAPYITVSDITAEGTVDPVVLCTFDNRNNILMRHKQSRLQTAVTAFNTDQNTVSDLFEVAVFHDCRIPFL